MPRAGYHIPSYEDSQEPSPSPYDPEYLTYLNVAALRASIYGPEPTSDDDDPVEPCAKGILELCFAGQVKEEGASWNSVDLPLKRPRRPPVVKCRKQKKSQPKPLPEPLPVCRIRFTWPDY